MKVKHVTFLVTVADTKTLLQTLNETLICGYCFVIGHVSAAPKKNEVAWLCGTGCVSSTWCMWEFEVDRL